ncbi:GNAT family N-acetyltransferase [Paenibacillus sp. PCH8]|uniref:GNAT family N-acetyltransferase n=1 Tax=Paenibacillus sp. PCH8 TaxID=2066524 RepID=UPI000CF8F1AA|nr:GNAT family N-acetyltransferase [Paenibacillus sp. PCH8]PQP83350.1 GNAT family N-acetyltransferase [Paenibacillus sp. PCH8]
MTHTTDIEYKTIEELSLNHWQPLSTLLYDGWVLRFAKGITKRANSIQPIHYSTLDVHEKIEECERIYASNQLSTIFKITPFIQPDHLDQLLQDKGYTVVDLTQVQTRMLDDIQEPVQHAVQIDEQLTTAWLDHFCRLNQVNDLQRETTKLMLHNIRTQVGFISLLIDGQVVACGFGVIERGYIGLYDIITDANFRNQGLAEQMILHLLHWAKRQGATSSFLQVVAHNAPAIKLYAKLGYSEIYSYWYRVKE